MKGLIGLKKLSLIYSILGVICISADSNLQNYLTQDKNQIFDYEEMKNQLEMDKLHDSWLSPVTITYKKDWTTQPLDDTKSSSVFSIGIDQPIFRSGGIYYAIKYSDVLRNANSQEISIKKRELIVKAIDILFGIKKLKLQHQKLKLLISNNTIDIQKKRDGYNAGLVDSSLLDQAILERNKNQSQLLDIELKLENFRNSFKILSKKNPDKLRTPKLKMISLASYKQNNMDLAVKELKVLEKQYNKKIIWAKYLPTFSVNTKYINNNQDLPNMNHDYFTYGFKISIPLNINSATDIESSRLSYIKAVTQLQDSRRSATLEYNIVQKSISILEKRISLAKQDEMLYARLYKRTKDLVKVGEKTEQDSQTMLNSLKVKRLDKKIYNIEKQQQLLKLYSKVSR